MNNTAIDTTLVEQLVLDAQQSPRFRSHYSLHQSHQDPLQRLLIAMEPESYVRPHWHHSPAKDESILILQGQGAAVLFDPNGQVSAVHGLSLSKKCFGVDIGAGQYHSLIAFEPSTVFFECKSGPYQPTKPSDFASWAPPEGDSLVKEFSASLVAQVKQILGWG